MWAVNKQVEPHNHPLLSFLALISVRLEKTVAMDFASRQKQQTFTPKDISMQGWHCPTSFRLLAPAHASLRSLAERGCTHHPGKLPARQDTHEQKHLCGHFRGCSAWHLGHRLGAAPAPCLPQPTPDPLDTPVWGPQLNPPPQLHPLSNPVALLQKDNEDELGSVI